MHTVWRATLAFVTDIDQTVRQAVDTVTMLAGRATKFAGKVLLVVVVICVGGFAAGVAALSDGIETVWIVLGVVFGSIAIGSALVATWRVGSVRRHVPQLADEVRTLLSEGASTTGTVIDTFIVNDGDNNTTNNDNNNNNTTDSAIVMSRQMYGFRSMTKSGLESSARLTAAVTAMTTFPLLLLVAVLITGVFGFLGTIFLIALAL